MKRAYLEEKIFKFLCRLATGSLLFVLLYVVYIVCSKGLSCLTWEMVSKTPQGGFYLGEEGGVLNAIMGSLYIGLGGLAIGGLLSLPTSFLINFYLPSGSRFSKRVRFSIDLLNGVPSIVYGAFGLMVMYCFHLRVSLGAGMITLGLLTYPFMTKMLDEVMKTVPKELAESSYALGSTTFETCFFVLLKRLFPGIVTCFLMGFGRAVGDSASVLFTAGFSDHIPTSLNQQSATLPLSVFFQLTSPIPEVRNRAYASAFILMAIIFVVSFTARLISGKKSKCR